MPLPPANAPTAPGGRVQRLDSLTNPQPRPPPRARKVRPVRCINSDCDGSTPLEVEDGKLLCKACGTVADDSSDFVTDVTFGEGQGGRAVLHGKNVGTEIILTHGGSLAHLRDNQLASFKKTISDGKQHIQFVVASLRINEILHQSAFRFFSLVAHSNFIQGRRIRSVAAVALYVACRAQKEDNLFMLIDFADVLDVDVFQLGGIYKDFLDELHVNNAGPHIEPTNPEHLVLRFAHELEFGAQATKIARDAVRIVKRMKRDFMLSGRRPAGVCGAALILAARMNNFNRTVREMSYVVKVNEITIQTRLEEFKNLESAGLTIEDFRTIDLEVEIDPADPPILMRNKDDRKGKRGRKRTHIQFSGDGDEFGNRPTPARAVMDISSDDDASETATSREETPKDQGSVSKPIHSGKRSRRDMPPPPLPLDPVLQGEGDQTRPRTRASAARARSGVETRSQKGAANEHAMANVSPATTNDTSNKRSTSDLTAGTTSSIDTADPNATKAHEGKKRGRPRKTADSGVRIEDSEITAALADPFRASMSTLQATADVTPTAATESSTVIVDGEEPVPLAPQPHREISMSETIDDNEFEDDPEVRHCLLNSEEVEIKTRIWTSVNAEWIREKASKQYKYELEVANGTYRPPKTRARRRKRMGDLSTYKEQMGPDWEKRLESGEGLADSAAESVQLMMRSRVFARGKALSSKINYDKIRELYTPSSTGSRRTSVVADSPENGVQRSQSTQEDIGGPRDEQRIIIEHNDDTVMVGSGRNEEAQTVGAREYRSNEAVQGRRLGQREALDAIADELEDEGMDDEEGDEDDEDDDEDTVAGADDGDDDPYEAVGGDYD